MRGRRYYPKKGREGRGSLQPRARGQQQSSQHFMYNNIHQWICSSRWPRFVQPLETVISLQTRAPATGVVSPLCSRTSLSLSPSMRLLRATDFYISRFDESFALEKNERTSWPSLRETIVSILGLFVLLNVVAPYCHRFCTVHRCEIGAVRMPRNCCHHSSERCNN